MARIRITKCPMQNGGITDNNAPRLYNANGQQQWQGQGVDFRSPSPGYMPQMPMMSKPMMPQMPLMGGGDDQATYGNYGQGYGPEPVGNGAAGDVFGNAHGQYQMGGSAKRKVRIIGIPNTEMTTGGYADKGASRGYGNQQGGNSFALDRRWGTPAGYPNVEGQKQPFGQVGTTLPEADGEGDINVEKREVILGDFDQDGNQETLRADAPPHTEGGMDVDVPSNSFVFSDTKDLKIKDPKILEIFGMKPKRGGYTPATIAAKYDLNKFKATIQNPNTDEVSRGTAQLMSDNYMKKLNSLAAIQEGMKKMMGIDHNTPTDQPGQAITQYGGIPKAQWGINGVPSRPQSSIMTGNDISDMYDVAPSYYPVTTHRGPKSTTWTDPQLMQGAIDIGYPNQPNGLGFGNWANLHYPELIAGVNQQVGVPNTYSPANPIGPEWDLRHQYAIESIKQHQLPELDVQRLQPKARMLPQGPDTDMSWQEGQNAVNQLPTTPAFNTTLKATAGSGDPKKPWKGLPAMNPNTLGDALNLLQMSQVKRFQPYEPASNAVIPDTVFLDPTRALAATQEAANSAGTNDAISANSRAARATSLARQGQAGAEAANIIGQYDNQNNQIANGANTNAAQITNQLMAQQANRLAEMNKANFLSDRDYKREMGKLQSEYVGRMQEHHDQAVKTAWLNKTSPYFNIDPITQMPVFKSENAKAAYEKMYSGQGNSNAGSADEWKRTYDALVAKGIPDNEARDRASEINGWGSRTRSKYDKNSELQGTTVTRQYGGPSQYQLGGDFLGVASAPNPFEGAGIAAMQHSQSQPSTGVQDMSINNNIKVKPDAYGAYDYYVHDRGIPSHIAAGIIGNLYQESSLNPTAVNKKSGAYGLGQWLGKRKSNLFNWAGSNGRDPNDLHTQLDYVLEEPGESSKMWSALSQTNNPTDAALKFANVYERMGTGEANYKKRVSVANKLFNSNINQTMPDRAPMKYGGSPLKKFMD